MRHLDFKSAIIGGLFGTVFALVLIIGGGAAPKGDGHKASNPPLQISAVSRGAFWVYDPKTKMAYRYDADAVTLDNVFGWKPTASAYIDDPGNELETEPE